jgi:hypothetical protein
MSNPGPNITATSLLTQENVPQVNGHQIGASASALIGFWGATPVVQQASYGAITDASGGTAAASNGILTITGTYNSTIIANAIATLAAAINGNRTALVTAGLCS